MCSCIRCQRAEVSRDREAGHRPEHLAQEIDHRGNVEELDAQRLLAQVHHLKPGRLRRRGRHLRATAGTDRLRSHHEVGQLTVRSGAHLLGEVASRQAAVPARSPATPTSVGCLLTTRSKASEENGRSASSATSATRAARASARLRRANSTLGGQDSVAASTARPRAAGSQRRGQDFAAAGLDVERGPRPRHPLAHQPGITPLAAVPRWPAPRTRRNPSLQPAQRRLRR